MSFFSRLTIHSDHSWIIGLNKIDHYNMFTHLYHPREPYMYVGCIPMLYADLVLQCNNTVNCQRIVDCWAVTTYSTMDDEPAHWWSQDLHCWMLCPDPRQPHTLLLWGVLISWTEAHYQCSYRLLQKYYSARLVLFPSLLATLVQENCVLSLTAPW